MKKVVFGIFLLLSLTYAQKIKDIANVVGVRDNQLIGYGLVVGLGGTGDGSSSFFTLQSLANMLQTVNVKIDPNAIKSKNIAAVMVTASLPSFARQGDQLDVTISSIGDAKSLEGGTLVMTPLKGVDGEIYALAQGAVTIGGKNGKTKGYKNHETAGKILSGALVEREVSYDLYSQATTNLSLMRSNFKTAVSVQNRLNRHYRQRVATALDPRTIRIEKPENMSMVEFLAGLMDVEVDYVREKKIIIDERTGTVIAGIDIEVLPVMITHGDMTLKISPKGDVDDLQNVADIKDGVAIGVNEGLLRMQKRSVTVANVARALKKLGAKPKDVISIFQAMKRAGAINAKMEII
jgi:flagellar P-ring protein precursor FlgI